MRHTRIIVTHYGGPDALGVVEEECPEPKNGEVLVRVLAAGVSLPDVMAREGVHPETPPVPFTPGWDLVGVVERLGDGSSGIEPGQIVAALPIHGAYAEFVCLPQHELVPVPAGLDAAEAVSLVLNYITAYQMLHRSATVRPGEEAVLKLEARETKLFRSLAEVDFGIQVSPKHQGVVGDLLDRLRGLGRASSERLKQAEVGGVQQNDLLLSRALDHGHLTVADPLYDLACLVLKVRLGDDCSGHG
jgi:hypothetical protein